MDVTASIREIAGSYGSSFSMRKDNFSAQKTLDFAEANTLSDATRVRVISLPHSLNYKGDSGLFGAENYFLKIEVNLDRTVEPLLTAENYVQYKRDESAEEADSNYNTAFLSNDQEQDPTFFTAAEVDMWTVDSKPKNLAVVEIDNNKGGNAYQNIWIDVTLYSKGKKPVEKLYIQEDDFFYVGVHARNTRRLPYDFDIDMGLTVVSASNADARYVNKY